MMEDMSYLCRYRKSINQIRFNMNTEIKKRIEALRGFMNKNGITAFVVPSTDPHAGEYVPEHWDSPVLQVRLSSPHKTADYGQTHVILSKPKSSLTAPASDYSRRECQKHHQ